MLRRTVSQPIGLDRVEQLGGFNTSMQDLTVFARSRSSLVLDNDYTSDFLRQAEGTQWDNNEFGWQPIGRCRAMEYEEPDHNEIRVSEECDAVYVAEEEEVWNSSDLSLREKRVIVELLHSKKRLMKRNADLLKALDVCEDTNTHLEMENAALKIQIKSMKQSIQDAEVLMEEMDVIRGALAESETANSNLKSCISNLEKENKALIIQIETLTNEMSNILPERESDKNKITEMTQHIKALQQQLEKATVELEVKTADANSKDVFIDQLKASLEELSTREQTLRKAMKNLEGQLEFARVTAGGSFLKSGDIVLPATQNHLSLAEELGLLPGLPESDDEVDEVTETVKVKEEIHIAFQESGEEVNEVDGAIQVEEETQKVPQPFLKDQTEVHGEVKVHREVCVKKGIEEVKMKDLGKEVVQEIEEATNLLNEEEVTKLEVEKDVDKLQDEKQVNRLQNEKDVGKLQGEKDIDRLQNEKEVDKLQNEKEAIKCLNEKDVFKHLDEEDDKHDQPETLDVEEMCVCAAELGDAPQYQSVDYKGVACRSFGRGILAASTFSLGVVLSLSVISTVMPPQHSRSGLGCADFLWNTVSQTLEQYCSVQHIDMPPF